MLLLLEHLTFEVGCCRSVCKLTRSRRWVVFTQFLLQSFEENNPLPFVLWSERFRLLPSCNRKTQLAQWLHVFSGKFVSMVWHENIILVQFEDAPQGFLSGQGDRLSRDCSPRWDVAAGVVISRQPLSGKEVLHSLCCCYLLWELAKKLKLRCLEIWKANIICLNSILLSDLTSLLMYSGVAGLCCSIGGGEGLFFWLGNAGTSQGCLVVKLTAERCLQTYRWL